MLGVQLNRIISRRIRRTKDGVNLAADVNVAITGSIDEPGDASSRTSSTSRQSIVQRSGRQTVQTTNNQEARHDEQA